MRHLQDLKRAQEKNGESLSLGIETGIPEGARELELSRSLLTVVELQEASFAKNLKEYIDKVVFNATMGY